MISHAEKEKVNCEAVVTSSATTTKSTGSATGSTRLHSQPSANDTALGFKGKLLLSPPPGRGKKSFCNRDMRLTRQEPMPGTRTREKQEA